MSKFDDEHATNGSRHALYHQVGFGGILETARSMNSYIFVKASKARMRDDMATKKVDRLIGTKLRFQASIFLDAASIVFDPSRGEDVAKALHGRKFLVGRLQDPAENATTPIYRMGFASEDSSRQLILLGNRFDYSVLPTNPDMTDMGDFNSFCREAAKQFVEVMGFYQKRVHRLAAVQEGFLKDMSIDEMNEIAKRFLNYSAVSINEPPFEWDWRIATIVERQFGNFTEPTNTVVTLKRVSGQLTNPLLPAGPISFDRIRLDTDISTDHRNVVDRFGKEDISAFFERSDAWHRDVQEKIMASIGE